MPSSHTRQASLLPWRAALLLWSLDMALLSASDSATAPPWSLPGLSRCSSGDDGGMRILPDAYAYPVTGGASSVSLDKAQDTLWTATGSKIFKYRFSDLQILLSEDFAGDVQSSGLSVAQLPGGQLAVVDGKSQRIDILSGDVVSVDKSIQLDVTPFRITHNAAGGEFYMAVAGEPGTIRKVPEAGGASTIIIGPDSALWGGQPQVIQDLQYAGSTLGSLFLLSSDSAVIIEVNSEGELIESNMVRADNSVKALSWSETGDELVLLREGGLLEMWCHNLEAPAAQLAPGTFVDDTEQVWYDLGSYNSNIPCGSWGSLPAFAPATDLKDIVYSPVTQTFWVLDNGHLQERDITTGIVVREISKQRLAGLGLPEVTSMARMEARKLLLGTQEGNRLAVLNTGFPAAASGQVAVSDAQEAVIRLGNPASVELTTTVTSRMLAPNSLGAIFYSAEESRVYMAAGSSGIIWADLDGEDSAVALPQTILRYMGYPQVDSFVYSLVGSRFLLWCSTCTDGTARLSEVAAGDDGFTVVGTHSPDESLFESYPSTFAVSSDGGMVTFAAPNGQARTFCSLSTSNNTIVPAVSITGHVDLKAFVLSQSVADPPSPAPSGEPFTYLFGASCTGKGTSIFISTTTLYDCESKCSLWETCNAFTFNTANSKCFLKSQCFGYQQVDNPMDISALKPTST